MGGSKALAIGLALAAGIYVLLERTGLTRKKHSYRRKRVLVAGGSSGLGLAIATELKRRGATVTVTSRKKDELSKLKKKHGFGVVQLDVTDPESVAKTPVGFDYVFSCAGYSKPGLAQDLKIEDMKSMMETNFYGSVLLYMQFLKSASPEKRKAFVFISSTLGLHSFTGYAAYAPSKSALRSFFESVKDESELRGLDLYIYYVSTIKSPGLENEDRTKPSATFSIEGSSRGSSSAPEARAISLLSGMESSSVVTSDFTTRLFLHASDVSSAPDLISWLISPVFWKCFRLFSFYHTKRFHEKQ